MSLAPSIARPSQFRSRPFCAMVARSPAKDQANLRASSAVRRPSLSTGFLLGSFHSLTCSPFIDRMHEPGSISSSPNDVRLGRVTSQPENGHRTYHETDEAGKKLLSFSQSVVC